jgi:hypothetical protein
MINPFLQGSKNLLKAWKDIRLQLESNKSDYEHCKLVTDFWSKAPVSARVLDWDMCSSWSDAWQLIHSNEFDDSAISLGMFYTLLLGADERWNADRCVLKLIKDDVHSQQKIILSVDNKWLMNYEYKKIVSVNDAENDFYVQQTYSYDGKNHYILK